MSVTPARMWQRRRTEAQWAADNPVLGYGEIGVVIDSVPEFRIGDGVTPWLSLPVTPELASSDPAKATITTTAGVTTINVERLAPEVGYLTANLTPVNNSTTLVNATGLSVPVNANAVYLVKGVIVHDTSQIADIKLAWTAPAGVTGTWWAQGLRLAQTSTGGVENMTFQSFAWTTASSAGGAAVGTATTVGIQGLLIVAATAGTLQFQYAQQALDPTNTTVRAGSWISALRVD